MITQQPTGAKSTLETTGVKRVRKNKTKAKWIRVKIVGANATDDAIKRLTAALDRAGIAYTLNDSASIR